MTEQTAIVYTLDECPNCQTAKKILEHNGIEFEELKLSDPDVISDLNIAGIFPSSAPVIKMQSNFLNFQAFLEKVNATPGC